MQEAKPKQQLNATCEYKSNNVHPLTNEIITVFCKNICKYKFQHFTLTSNTLLQKYIYYIYITNEM